MNQPIETTTEQADKTERRTVYFVVRGDGETERVRNKKEAIRKAKTLNRLAETTDSYDQPKAVLRERQSIDRSDRVSAWTLSKSTAIAMDIVPQGAEYVADQLDKLLDMCGDDAATEYFVETEDGEMPVNEWMEENQEALEDREGGA